MPTQSGGGGDGGGGGGGGGGAAPGGGASGAGASFDRSGNRTINPSGQDDPVGGLAAASRGAPCPGCSTAESTIPCIGSDCITEGPGDPFDSPRFIRRGGFGGRGGGGGDNPYRTRFIGFGGPPAGYRPPGSGPPPIPVTGPGGGGDPGGPMSGRTPSFPDPEVGGARNTGVFARPAGGDFLSQLINGILDLLFRGVPQGTSAPGELATAAGFRQDFVGAPSITGVAYLGQRNAADATRDLARERFLLKRAPGGFALPEEEELEIKRRRPVYTSGPRFLSNRAPRYR